MGGRREAEPAAGVSRGGGAPASGERRGRVGRMRWRPWKVKALSIWGGRGRRGKLHGGPSLAALMVGGEVLGVREVVRSALL
jgi:hypothetical protein